MMDIDLKQVFSILDENDEGQIQLRRFVDVANNYYSDAEQLARITKALDPTNTGLINFEQFCEGIAQISSLQGLTLKEVASDLTRRSRENSLVEDSDRRSLKTNNGFDFSSLSSWPNLIQEEYQEGSDATFNEYDVENDEAFHPTNHKTQITNNRTPSLINSTTNTKKPNNQNSNRNNQSISPRLESPFYGDDEEFVAEPTSSIYSTDTAHPRAPVQRIPQPFKRNNYLQPVISPEQPEQQLQETVDELQKTVETLTEQKHNTTERLAKFQSENSELRSRLSALEDRFHDLEGQHTHTTKTEQQKYAEYILMSKLREQFSINDRLREYIERMLTVIIENNPQLLEVTTSSGVSIGSMSMSSLSSTTTPIENKNSKTIESIKTDSSVITNKQTPTDKYCRL
ncbi:unnamed protein product [Adineta steineri]|uniref:FIP-RBD domain-containing protein n=1 Tax=Adineta steineri TaxID=433720 RepID=A0A814LXZ1_9BILA|nr:unnamed protein product [Adineta steineri]